MGVRQEIRWLRGNEDRTKLFVLTVERGPIKARELKEYQGSDDWWPTKIHIRDLIERELIQEDEGGYRATPFGERVFESLKAVHDIKSV